jgi:tetratricopeptide (TPR) repeat protein
MRNVILILLLLSCITDSIGKDAKDAKKHKKAIAKEEHQFQKRIKKNPANAGAYLAHANYLSASGSEAQRALNYYQSALKYDSGNANTYRDYGRYMLEKRRAVNDAKMLLTKSLALSPNDAATKKYIESVDKLLALQEEENRMRDYGTTVRKDAEAGVNYAAITKFDSLKSIVEDDNNSFGYSRLLIRYLNDDGTLTPAEMYMLIVGYSRQSTYNPFNYNDIYEVRGLAAYNLDTAIRKGTALLKSNPLNPSLNRELMYCYRKKKDTAGAAKYLNRIHQFFDGVLYSGNGMCEKPYISLWGKEEYSFINYLGYKQGDNHAMGTCAGQMAEIIDVKRPGSDSVEQMHFNVALIYMRTAGK